MPPRLAFAALAALGLSGCISDGPFPSLAPRPDERLAIEEPVRAAPVVADDAALRARIQTLLGDVRAGERGFDEDHGPAARAAARSGPVNSDSWIEAQQALSRLEASGTRSADAAASLHALGVERGDQPTSEADRAMLADAIAAADAIVAGQRARLARLGRD